MGIVATMKDEEENCCQLISFQIHEKVYGFVKRPPVGVL